MTDTKTIDTNIKLADDAKKNYDEYADLQKQTLNSFSQAFSLWTKGVEDMNKEVFSRMQTAFEKNISDSKTLTDAKDPQAFFTAQNELATKAVGDMLSTSAYLSEQTAKLANTSFEPVQKQMAKNWDSLNKHLVA